MTKEKAIVLLSGGLDSTVNLYEANNVFNVIKVLTFNYGQKAFLKELQAAQFFCKELNLSWQNIDLTWLSEVSSSSLTLKKNIPQGAEVDITSYKKSLETAKSVWVPNRNGLFINIAGVFADGLGAKYIVPGFNKEEAETFPDNSEAFIQASNSSLAYSTQNRAEVFCFTIAMDKIAIVKKAQELCVPLNHLWPCYNDYDSWCGECESCLRFNRAVKIAGL